jgi:hypothetical protein
MEYLFHKWPRIYSTCRKHFNSYGTTLRKFGIETVKHTKTNPNTSTVTNKAKYYMINVLMYKKYTLETVFSYVCLLYTTNIWFTFGFIFRRLWLWPSRIITLPAFRGWSVFRGCSSMWIMSSKNNWDTNIRLLNNVYTLEI